MTPPGGGGATTEKKGGGGLVDLSRYKVKSIIKKIDRSGNDI